MVSTKVLFFLAMFVVFVMIVSADLNSDCLSKVSVLRDKEHWNFEIEIRKNGEFLGQQRLQEIQRLLFVWMHEEAQEHGLQNDQWLYWQRSLVHMVCFLKWC
jgi:hypothetical protein